MASAPLSPYEGADLILDLNQPIPDEYEGIADFIFGGSVCDNVFDPSMYIRNISRMLKAGGRYISLEIASNHYHPYVILPPSWHFDYFVINQFNDVQVLVSDIHDSWNVYGLDVDPSYTILPNFTAASDHTLGVFVIAEKGRDSTWHRSPTQDQYRGQVEWAEYRTSLRRIREGARPFPSFRLPTIESDLESHPPRWVPHYRYLGRLDLTQDPTITRARDRTTSLLARWNAEEKRRIAIWGAAGFAEDLFTTTPLGETPIILVVDSNEELHGKLWHGCDVEGPDALARVKPDAVLVASVTFHDEIAHSLDGMAATLGFDVGRIL